MMFLAGLMMAIAVEHSGLHYRYFYIFLIWPCTATNIPFMYSQKKKLRGLSPNFHCHVSVSDLYIP
jgi:hypothetical protein